MIELTEAKRRIVEHLKRVDSATANELASEFQLTDTAVRQHLDALQAARLVERIDGTAQGRGRPPASWRLTADANGAFPDRHAELTLDLLESIRTALGPAALDAVVADRSARQAVSYRSAVGNGSVSLRVRRLAEQRTAEGYAAEVRIEGNDVLLVEHHCPICVAASNCQSLCRAELEVFQSALGNDVDVRREQHLLSGDQRCVYRISSRPA